MEYKMYKVVVWTKGDVKPSGNGLRFETIEAATNYGKNLYARWVAVERFEVVEVNE